MSQVFTRYLCWNQDRINSVINVEATAVDRATFLATHTPLHTIRYEKSQGREADSSERELLEELQSSANDDRHTFVVIKGIPGTGKSHLIRWLKDRYEQEQAAGTEQDVVLLIERAHSSLRGTLRQIIGSGVFESDAMQRHLDRLERASESLSREGFSNALTNNFQTAAVEHSPPKELNLSTIVSKSIAGFLLDQTVREDLQSEGGPIDRIVQFLTEGIGEDLQPGETPEFTADDFNFSAATLHRIQYDGNPDARSLTRGLKAKPELREQTAAYLNRLRSYAVGYTMQLSVDDVRQIFNDLRHDLRQRGKSLALFIEDITAFSGIDTGLIDVLATQHTGEGNREFCRILSVTGITDSYYQDQFPDNLKERVTHRLNLNAKGAGSSRESELLQRDEEIAELAARYLNAIRLPADKLERWANRGGNPEDLPIACTTCPHREPCHQAFGAVDVGAMTPIGLYPFNNNALATMYRGLKENRTPRSLLRDIIQYNLHNHGPAIATGGFPPTPMQLNSHFQLPSLKIGHDSVIDNQAGDDRSRVTSLVSYWGDGTVDSKGTGEDRTVGGLSAGVFKAFDIPFISGQPTTIQDNVERAEVDPIDEPEPDSNQPDPSPESQAQNPYANEIRLWREGARLDNYQRPRELAIRALLTAIDWDAHEIPFTRVRDRLRANYIRIEGQAGRVTGDFLELRRSSTFASALIALTNIESIPDLQSDVLGGNLLEIKTWIDEVEDSVVQLVRQPRSDVSEPMPLLELLVIDAILLDWLAGDLSPDHINPEQLFLQLVASARATAESTDAKALWEQAIERAGATRGPAWSGAMRNIGSSRAEAIRRNLLDVLNVSQGASPNVLFVNAPSALTYIERFLTARWRLHPIDRIENPVTEGWTEGLRVYSTGAEMLRTVLDEETRRYSEQISTLERFVGEASPSEVFEAITSVLDTYRELKLEHRFVPQPELGAGDLRSTISALRNVTGQKRDTRRALAISGSAPTFGQASQYVKYFAAFMQFGQQEESRFNERITQLQQGSSTTQALVEVEDLYQDIDHRLQRAAPTHSGQEAAG